MMKYMPDYKRVNAEHSLKKLQYKLKLLQKSSLIQECLYCCFYLYEVYYPYGIIYVSAVIFMKFRGSEAIFASALVSAFLLGGVAGTYTGAVLSDRLGARRIILGSIILSIPTIWLISHAGTEIGAMLAVVASGFLSSGRLLQLSF